MHLKDAGWTAPAPSEAEIARLRTLAERVRDGMRSAIIGQDQATDLMVIGLLARGHVLLEGPPGVGKTLMVRALAQIAGLSFSRVQFTPDLMPADITGASVLVPDADGRTRLEFRSGPIFSQVLLADEINRATPRTQSALLEAMQEGTVSAGGSTMALPEPFCVLATQNPIEMDGTYALPEAQIDRFLFRIDVSYPTAPVLSRILDATTGATTPLPQSVATPDDILALQALVRLVPMAPSLQDAVARFCVATQPQGAHVDAKVARFIRFGISPRGAQALVVAAKAQAFIRGRDHVAIEDMRSVLLPVARHRVQANFEGRAANTDIEALVLELFDKVMKDA